MGLVGSRRFDRASRYRRVDAPREDLLRAQRSARRNINLAGFDARGNSVFADDLKDQRSDNHGKLKRARYLGDRCARYSSAERPLAG